MTFSKLLHTGKLHVIWSISMHYAISVIFYFVQVDGAARHFVCWSSNFLRMLTFNARWGVLTPSGITLLLNMVVITCMHNMNHANCRPICLRYLGLSWLLTVLPSLRVRIGRWSLVESSAKSNAYLRCHTAFDWGLVVFHCISMWSKL